VRTYRPDKLTLAALEATLHAWSDLDSARVRIPTVRMLSESIDVLERRASALCGRLRAARPVDAFEVCETPSYAGGGTLPTIELPSRGVRWRPADESPETVHARLRGSRPPIVARVHDGAVWLDARTVSDDDVDVISNVVGCWG
jgi:L-seryl-tRNA(Ser) seleniumtransferase